MLGSVQKICFPKVSLTETSGLRRRKRERTVTELRHLQAIADFGLVAEMLLVTTLRLRA